MLRGIFRLWVFVPFENDLRDFLREILRGRRMVGTFFGLVGANLGLGCHLGHYITS